jgi:hypothetical protein
MARKKGFCHWMAMQQCPDPSQGMDKLHCWIYRCLQELNLLFHVFRFKLESVSMSMKNDPEKAKNFNV